MTTKSNHNQPSANCLLYVGTYAQPDADGLFLYEVNPQTGALTRLSAAKAGPNPSFLTLDTQRRHLYAVNETSSFQGRPGGGVSAFALDPQTGQPRLLNQQAVLGAAPCYISLDQTNRCALVATYVGGNVSLLPLQPDGQLGPVADTEQHSGASVHKNQDAPHAHCILPDPANRFAFAVDLGTDSVYGYRLNAPAGTLEPLPAPAFRAAPGAGPRHLAFHPGGQWAYLINELNSTVTALRYDAANGTFRELQTLPTLPADYQGPNSCADIHVAPNGRFLYGSNRGHDSLVVYAIEAGSGRLSLVQHVPTLGQKPRNFALDPTGQLVLVANQASNNIVTFRVDGPSGRLTPTGHSAEVPAPVCLQVVADFRRR